VSARLSPGRRVSPALPAPGARAPGGGGPSWPSRPPGRVRLEKHLLPVQDVGLGTSFLQQARRVPEELDRAQGHLALAVPDDLVRTSDARAKQAGEEPFRAPVAIRFEFLDLLVHLGIVQPRADRSRADPELSGDLDVPLALHHQERQPVFVPLDLRTGTPRRTTEASPSRRTVKRHDLGHADSYRVRAPSRSRGLPRPDAPVCS